MCQKIQKYKCVITGEELPVEELIRFVRSPLDVIVPDIAHKLPVMKEDGEYWVTANSCAIEKFEKDYMGVMQPIMVERLQTLLKEKIMNWLSLANKSGAVIYGYNKVDPHLRSGKACLLLQAADAAKGGKEKLAFLAHASEIEVMEVLTVDQLSNVLGNENIVHVIVLKKKFSNKIKHEMRRLAGFYKKDSL